MSRIEFVPKVRCDRCGEVFAEDVHHGKVAVWEGFGDLRPGKGHLATVRDLCDACLREVRDHAAGQTEMEL